ncbi:unnamed protein product [Prunus armeniaca]
MWDFAQVAVVVTRVMVLMLLVLVVLMLDMLVGAVGHSLVPQVGKLEVASTLGREPGLGSVELSFGRGWGLEALAREP